MTKKNIPKSAMDKLLPRLDVGEDKGVMTVTMTGAWTTHSVQLVDENMKKLEASDAKKAIINIQHIDSLDTAGTWMVERLGRRLKERGIDVTIQGARPSWESLLKSVERGVQSVDEAPQPERRLKGIAFFESIGRFVVGSWYDFLLAMHILGSTIRGAQLKFGRGSGINLPAIISQVDRMGVGAVPIIILMAFIVGAIIAQQGAFQLRNFGADLFVVDLVGILVFRELGVLLTAIMIAGRSGSAITAEIGSMKMREETDAMLVMGLNPIGVLVFPRLLALAIVLPLLTVVADIAAIVGAAVVANIYSGINYHAFLDRLTDAVWLTTYFAGLIKAPFMALVIGIIACVEGLKVGGSAESLGQRVTSSVVKSIFIVIVMDGFFAIFYAAINF